MITTFKDLYVWQEAHKLALIIYTMTKLFPKDEQFGITQQIRRAAVSVTSNIAEGFSRFSYKDKIHFYTMSLGSLTELQSQLFISKDIGYVQEDQFNSADQQTVLVHKLLNALIKKSRSIIPNS